MKFSRQSKVATEGVFGSLDGYNTAVSVLVAQSHLFIVLALTISVGGALSMAAGELVSALNDPERSLKAELPAAAAMGLATFAGTFIPCLPALFLSQALGIAFALVLGLALATLVGYVNGGRRKDFLTVFVVFFVVLIPTALIGLLA